MLRQRIITASIIGIVITSSVLYLPLIGFKLLAGITMALGGWEFAGFFWQNDYKNKIGFLVVMLLAAWISQFFLAEPTLLIGVLWWLVVPYFLRSYTREQKRCFNNIFWQYLVGIVVFVPCFVGLVEIQEKFGANFLLYLVAIICAADIGGYFAGRFWGRHLLASKISPKKTFEGVFGGVLFALVIAVLGDLLLQFGIVNSGKRGVSFLMLIIIVSLWSVIGDLFESMLKRQAGVKDSGLLLPGHGGIYDRIDSLTAAIPIFVLGILLC